MYQGGFNQSKAQQQIMIFLKGGKGFAPVFVQQPQYHQQSSMPGMGQPDRSVDDIYRDFSYKLENQVQQNIKTSAAVSELENILENERRKAKDIRDKIEMELENERRLRVDFENKFIKLKDETMKREMLVTELDFKMSNVAQENSSLIAENMACKEENQRLHDAINMKIREYDDKIAQAQRIMEQMEDSFHQDYQKLEMRYQQQYEDIQRNWEQKYKYQDEQMMKLLANKKELENEIKLLQDSIMKQKLEAQEEARELAQRIQEEEYKKYTSNLKMLEQKLSALDQQREQLWRKNQELAMELQERDKRHQEDFQRSSNEISSLKHEISELKNQFNQADILVGKLRQELSHRDGECQRLEAKLGEGAKQLQQQRDQARQEIDKLYQESQNEKKYLEDQKRQSDRRGQELERILEEKDRELIAIRSEYDRLCQMLQNNINKTIFQTMSDAVITNKNQFAANNQNQKSQVGANSGLGQSSMPQQQSQLAGSRLIAKY